MTRHASGLGESGAVEAGKAGAARFPASGLVNTATSPTDDLIHINSHESRLRGMRLSVITAARLIDEAIQRGGFRYRRVMLTFTYRNVDDWRPRDISQALEAIREYMRRRGHRLIGVWTSELQERGAVHYHIVLWLPHRFSLPFADKRGWWRHGMTSSEWARNAVGYLVKYVSKGTGPHRFPRGCRIHGAMGLSRLQRMERRWWRFPRYVRERFVDWRGDVARAKGGGFVEKESGDWLPAQYAVAGFTRWGPVIRRIGSAQVAVG
jgi:hypothetical protein